MKYIFRDNTVIEYSYDGIIHIDSYELKEGERWVTSKDEPKHHFVINGEGEITKGLGGWRPNGNLERPLLDKISKILASDKIGIDKNYEIKDLLDKQPIGITIQNDWGDEKRQVIKGKDGKWYRKSKYWNTKTMQQMDTMFVVEHIVGEIRLGKENFISQSDIKKLEQEWENSQKENQQTFIVNLKKAKSLTNVNEIANKYFKDKIGCNIELTKVDVAIAKQWLTQLDLLSDKYNVNLYKLNTEKMDANTGGRCGYDQYTGKASIAINPIFAGKKSLIDEKRKEDLEGVNFNSIVDEKNESVKILTHEVGHSLFHTDILRKTHPKQVEQVESLYKEYVERNQDLLELYKNVSPKQKQKESMLSMAEMYENNSKVFKGYVKQASLIKAKQLREEADKIVVPVNEMQALTAIGIKVKKTLVSQYSLSSVEEFIAECYCEAMLSSQPHDISKKVLSIINEVCAI